MLVAAVLLLCASASFADLHDDIGYTQLESLLGSNLPSGLLSTIEQIEASIVASPETPKYLANDGLASFPGTQIIDRSGINNVAFSGHANGVAQRLGGISSNSLLPGLVLIDAYETLNWIAQVLKFGTATNPALNTGEIANHSWAGSFDDDADNLELLGRLDWLIERENFFQAVGSSSTVRRLLAYAMNVVAVKNTSSTALMSTDALDGVYAANRPALHLVVPQGSPSNATGVVSSAAALLREIALPNILSADTLKAILMAGAMRVTNNTQNGEIDNYGATPSNNGLDYRYGAGQLNVLNSYRVLAAGKQGSLESGGSDILANGYDYVENFGTTSGVQTYRFTSESFVSRLCVSLAWNLHVRSVGGSFNPDPVLYNLELALYDTTSGENVLIAESASLIDNTENLWVLLEPSRDYELRVLQAHPTAFSWPYALAWRQTQNGVSDTAPVQISTLPLLGLFCFSYLLYLMARRQLAPHGK